MTIQPAARVPLRRAVVIGALRGVFGDIGTSLITLGTALHAPIQTFPKIERNGWVGC
jgi:K+ transporter